MSLALSRVLILELLCIVPIIDQMDWGPQRPVLVMCFAAYALILLSHMCFFYILDPICGVVASSPPDRLDLD